MKLHLIILASALGLATSSAETPFSNQHQIAPGENLDSIVEKAAHTIPTPMVDNPGVRSESPSRTKPHIATARPRSARQLRTIAIITQYQSQRLVAPK